MDTSTAVAHREWAKKHQGQRIVPIRETVLCATKADHDIIRTAVEEGRATVMSRAVDGYDWFLLHCLQSYIKTAPGVIS